MKLLIKILGLFSLSLILMHAFDAHARDIARKGSFANRAGKTGTFEQKVNRAPGSVNRETQWKNPRGGGGNTQYQRSWDKESGTGTSSRTTTNAQGQTATTNKTYTRNEDGSLTVNGTHTGFNGKTRTWTSGFHIEPANGANVNE